MALALSGIDRYNIMRYTLFEVSAPSQLQSEHCLSIEFITLEFLLEFEFNINLEIPRFYY